MTQAAQATLDQRRIAALVAQYLRELAGERR
jgi:hypothetical protein